VVVSLDENRVELVEVTDVNILRGLTDKATFEFPSLFFFRTNTDCSFHLLCWKPITELTLDFQLLCHHQTVTSPQNEQIFL
jgi:hypothetical protein